MIAACLNREPLQGADGRSMTKVDPSDWVKVFTAIAGACSHHAELSVVFYIACAMGSSRVNPWSSKAYRRSGEKDQQRMSSASLTVRRAPASSRFRGRLLVTHSRKECHVSSSRRHCRHCCLNSFDCTLQIAFLCGAHQLIFGPWFDQWPGHGEARQILCCLTSEVTLSVTVCPCFSSLEDSCVVTVGWKSLRT